MIDKSYIVGITQQIVDKSFTSSIERKIFQHDNRINLRCPYCLEGKTKGKKRGNVYFDKLIYVCFRCGKKTNFDKFKSVDKELFDKVKFCDFFKLLISKYNFVLCGKFGCNLNK